MALTPKERAFVSAYFAHGMNGTKAAIAVGYSPRGADVTASRLLVKPRVKEVLEAKRAELLEKADLTSADILQMLKARATADVRKLIELKRDCCRYCYGVDHGYQETPSERKKRKDAHQQVLKATPEKHWKSLPPFDELGGLGFDPRKPPMDDCPECFGRGVETILPKDTSTFTDREVSIYEGVKVSSTGGLEIKLSSRSQAIDRLAQINGLYGKDDDGSGDFNVKIRGGLPEPEA